MFFKTLVIFSSLGSAAIIPFVLPGNIPTQKSQEDSQKALQSLQPSPPAEKASRNNDQFNQLSQFNVKDLLKNYCQKVSESMVVCKNKESFPWPVFYYLENQLTGKGSFLKVQSLTFKRVDSNTILDIDLVNGEKKQINDFPTGWGFEYFDKETLVPEVDCITLDNAGGGHKEDKFNSL